MTSKLNAIYKTFEFQIPLGWMLFEFNAISKALEFNIPLGVLDKINNPRE